jgi:signal transduction histidine kinase
LKDTDHPFISAAAFVLIAYVIRLGLGPLIGHRSPWLLFTVAIVVAAGRYGVRPGLLAMALSFVLGLTLYPAAAYQSAGEAITSLVVFLSVGAAMLVFAAHLKASQQRAMQLQSELNRVHTESAIGAMASILAHELNQPLAAASNYVTASRRLLEAGEGLAKPKVVAAMGEAEGQIQRAGEIIRHARDLVRNAGAKREPASLRVMVARVSEVLRAGGIYDKGAIRTEIEPDADEVLANPVQVEQVLVNLLRNAWQASDDEPDVLVRAAPSNGSTIIEVRDRGRGIPEDRLPDLFSVRGQSSQGGLGLGLSISRTIVEAHGGRIWAENRPGGGASIVFTMPRAA